MKRRIHSRRRFLRNGLGAGIGLGFVPPALQTLAAAKTDEKPSPVNPKPAKSVVYLYMFGGMTHIDCLDPKPELKESYRGKTTAIPTSAAGIQLGNWLPRMAKQMHHVAVINSMTSITGAHAEGTYLMHTNYQARGTIVHPSLGTWMQVLKPADPNLKLDIPRNVVISGPSNHPAAGFFPARHGPLMIGNGAGGLDDVAHRGDMDDLKYRLDLGRKLDAEFQKTYRQKNVASYREMYSDALALMESSDLDVFDLTREHDKVRQSYGRGFGDACLLARRLVERGVRFVQLFTSGQQWDNHSSIATSLPNICRKTDLPVAGLLADLKQRGLMDDVLVVWGGEFGRLPIAQMRQGSDLKKAGRDHGPTGFSVWFAGAGIKGGTVYGNTDEIGWRAAENRVSVNDWHATILHALGLHNEQLFFETHGFKERLTGVEKVRVVKEILA